MKYPRYTKDLNYSYCYGIYPVLELLTHKPMEVLEILISSKGSESNSIVRIIELCDNHDIKITYDDTAIEKLTNNASIFVVGVFKKYDGELHKTENHVVLVNPTDMGNVGAIVRTCLGFGVGNLAMIKPGIDSFDPKVVRASMGAIFSVNIEYFDSFDEYIKKYLTRKLYAFMPDAETTLDTLKPETPFSLIFGSEGEGLSQEFKKLTTAVSITQSQKVDSLNLAVAVGIGLYEFTKHV